MGERAGDNLDTGSDIVVELTAVGGRFWKKSGFNIASRHRRMWPPRRRHHRWRGLSILFFTSTSATADANVPTGSDVADVYMGRTLDEYRGGGSEYGIRSRPIATLWPSYRISVSVIGCVRALISVIGSVVTVSETDTET